MAKKAVASLQSKSKRLTKAIKMVKSPKTGAYSFVESILPPEKVNEFLSKINLLTYFILLLLTKFLLSYIYIIII